MFCTYDRHGITGIGNDLTHQIHKDGEGEQYGNT